MIAPVGDRKVSCGGSHAPERWKITRLRIGRLVRVVFSIRPGWDWAGYVAVTDATWSVTSSAVVVELFEPPPPLPKAGSVMSSASIQTAMLLSPSTRADRHDRHPRLGSRMEPLPCVGDRRGALAGWKASRLRTEGGQLLLIAARWHT